MPRRKKGVTFRLKKAFLSRFKNKDVIVEFYLPRDCPSLCAGCTTCFLKDQNLCKDAAFVQKIEKEMLGGFSFALGGRRNLDNREQLGLDNHTCCRSPKSLIRSWTKRRIHRQPSERAVFLFRIHRPPRCEQG